MEKISIYNENEEYVQSANTLFHFMKERQFLTDILNRKALVPRYCNENIPYLDIEIAGKKIDKISILQKCFCDMHFHKLSEKNKIKVVDDDEITDEEKEHIQNSSSHTDFYGGYAVAFSKRWGEEKGLQPIVYVNSESDYTKTLKDYLKESLRAEKLNDVSYNYILSTLGHIKPIRGEMERITDSGKIVKVIKNFHDEKEWRYVPRQEELIRNNLQNIIVSENVLKKRSTINRELQNIEYQNIWLRFEYEDIKYIIVPNRTERIELIKFINLLPDNNFRDDDGEIDKDILISRILVLEEIRGDW
ncbi:MAG TPA: hypothetical protein DD446_09180 [Coprococcus sp.]|uniref:abortive infection system antitoxin AbiGi family protein n=1 Tax=Coprococcus eutactus TaxID=33043 RepID=UPI000E7FD8CC|nr:abortive infection system antitoxin AbiGi family protein [Coprococcus eutactus]NSE72021.1 hypothetical protein [Coprococcus eutactus]HAQ91223.1 hypothetical protein [Coprococcus sp.]HBN41006.1 hypothetical protein [Coprococcus sp.]